MTLGEFSWVCVEFRECVFWRLNDLTSSRALETHRRCSLRWVLRRGNGNSCEGVIEMAISTLGTRRPGSCWRCWLLNLRSKFHVGQGGSASRLASVLVRRRTTVLAGSRDARSQWWWCCGYRMSTFEEPSCIRRIVVSEVLYVKAGRRRKSAALATIAVIVKHPNTTVHACWVGVVGQDSHWIFGRVNRSISLSADYGEGR
jgi:hypothetical protein